MAQEPDPDHKKLQYPPDFNAYRILDEIGVGVSAVVYKAICIPMNSTVAIKSIDLDQSRADFDTIRLETKTMSLLFHPNILESHCSFTVDRRLWVVMPFMSAGSLQSIISSAFPDGLPEPCIAAVLKETLNAVSYLHNQGHLHRDIKAGNILIDSNGHVKLADFGVSASIYEPKIAKGGNFLSSCSPRLMLTDLAGTPYWMAPEVIHSHTGYSLKADIWSFGITAMELAHGCPPLSHLPPSKSMLMKITKRFRFSDYEKHKTVKNKKFSKAFKDMVASCLDQDPSKRPSAEKLLRHSFFKNCKGLEFLVKNLLHGLPSVEERFKQSRGCCVGGSGGEGEDEKEIGGGLKGQIVKNRRISGWNFNEAGFELDPIFPTESREDDDTVVKQVRFRGETETIIHDRKFEFGDSSESGGSSLNSLGWAGDESQVGGAHGGGVAAEGIGDRERMLGGLIALRMSLDMQRMNVVNLISVLGGEVVTSDDDEELMRANENLRFELENEKEKNYRWDWNWKFSSYWFLMPTILVLWHKLMNKFVSNLPIDL